VPDADRTLPDFYEMTGLEDVAQRVRKGLLIGSEPDGTETSAARPGQMIPQPNGSAGFSRIGIQGRCVIPPSAHSSKARS